MSKISTNQSLRASTADAADAARVVLDAACREWGNLPRYEAARAAYDAARAAAVRASVRQAVEAYREALAAERLQPENRLVHGFTVYQQGYDRPTSGEWRRLAALLVSEGDPYAPWGAYGAFFVTRSSGWPDGSPTVTLWANRRPLVTALGSEGSHVKVSPHGNAAVRLWRERRATERREAAARNEMFQPLLQRLDEHLVHAPTRVVEHFVETGEVLPSLQAGLPAYIRLQDGQQGGSVWLQVCDPRTYNYVWRRFGLARRARRALDESRAECGAARCATLPAVWRRGFDADL